MRVLTLTTLSIAAIAVATPADAQRVWRDGQWVERGSVAARTVEPIRYPDRSIPDARINPPAPVPTRVPAPVASSRWGTKIDGRWHAGVRAPGGWSAYRRPVRGWTLPSYWVGGNFWINDWSNWGLSRPPYGYGWVRYYDDAVLADRSGRVWDSVSGVDWDRAGAGGTATAYAGSGYASASAAGGGGYGASYAPPGYNDDRRYDDRRYEDRRYDERRYDERYEDRDGGWVEERVEHRYDDRDARRDSRRVDRRPITSYPTPAPYPAPCAGSCGGYGGGYYGQGGAYAGGYAGGGYYMTGPTVTTVVIQSGAATTTTVTEEVVEEVRETTRYRAPTKVVRRTPSKLVRRSVKDCGC